jgi:NDP-4-keto-2,6-dideoxyhexose 3-C-methyltransferase
VIFTTRTTCRSCESPRLASVFFLGVFHISNFVDLDAPQEDIKAPLDLVLCEDCSLLQLRHSTNPELLWKHYWYRSGINNTMRQALAEITALAERVTPLSPGDLVLDIGCNDGTLLRSYRSGGIRLVGFEPADNLIAEAKVGTTRIINDFFNFEAFRAAFGNARARVITSISMFYDLEHPNTFVADIARCLDPDGVWLNQMNYLPAMLEKDVFDNIGHEHLEYYSLLSLESLLARHRLEVFDVELTNLNGGSFRVYIRHPGSRAGVLPGAEERLREVRVAEEQMGLRERAVYERFAERANAVKAQVCDFVRQELARGKTIYAYGASTRGSTLLQFFGLDSRAIQAAAERSPHKFGKKTTGTWIPIISEEEARRKKPDYFLVLPYFFFEEFRQREREYLASGGKFIVPLPEFRIISG